jgi:hypothetical protein
MGALRAGAPLTHNQLLDQFHAELTQDQGFLELLHTSDGLSHRLSCGAPRPNSLGSLASPCREPPGPSRD